jgi:hypothetical protein
MGGWLKMGYKYQRDLKWLRGFRCFKVSSPIDISLGVLGEHITAKAIGILLKDKGTAIYFEDKERKQVARLGGLEA